MVDLAQLTRLDTLGAWVLERTRGEIEAAGGRLDLCGRAARAPHPPRRSAPARAGARGPRRRGTRPSRPSTGSGAGWCAAGSDVVTGLAFLGEVVAACVRRRGAPVDASAARAFVNQVEQVALRGVPIIVLISFLVGGIVAQQGIFQLQRFGAAAFVVNLIGILILRELGVLLTSIMVAGRSGSAFTAEIGSMRMREEVDALRVMGLDPIEVLIVPRILALDDRPADADLHRRSRGARRRRAHRDGSMAASRSSSFLARLQAAVGAASRLSSA